MEPKIKHSFFKGALSENVLVGTFLSGDPYNRRDFDLFSCLLTHNI